MARRGGGGFGSGFGACAAACFQRTQLNLYMHMRFWRSNAGHGAVQASANLRSAQRGLTLLIKLRMCLILLELRGGDGPTHRLHVVVVGDDVVVVI